jgi:glycosyltransferase involved in cell wall biosynthesis
MNNKPIVSVIISFLNAEKFIRETIESVLAQTYENWELLFVDDGSTDNSTYVAKEFAKSNPEKIYYFEHDDHRNHGTSASINLGIAKARGDLFSFLNADDIWLPQYLEQLVSILESFSEAAMVYSPAHIWRNWKGTLDVYGRDDSIQNLGVKLDRLFMPLTLLAHWLQDEGSTPCTGATLVRRAAIERIGGWEENFRGMYDDQVFYSKICSEAPVFVSSEIGFWYRRHPESMCVIAGKTGDHYAKRFTFLEWVETYLSKKRVKNITVWAILKKELLPYRHPFLYCLVKERKSIRGLLHCILPVIPKQVKHGIKIILMLFFEIDIE